MVNLRFSVAMCTYNGSRYLTEQLQSIAAQDHLPNEMSVRDDGSTDETIDLINAFARQAPFPVHIEVNKERLGPAKNFAKAIGWCHGDIIALADQDDIWKRHKIRRLAATLAEHPDATYAFSDAEIEGGKGTCRGATLWERIGFHDKLERFEGSGQLEVLLKRNYVTGAALAIRASFRDIALPIPDGWMHDYWISVIGSTFSYGVPINEPLFSYRLHNAQTVGMGKPLLQTIRRSISAGDREWSARLQSFKELEDRVASASVIADCPTDRIDLIRQKGLHLSRRARIRSSTGVTRLARLLAEARTGRYQRFSGWDSMLRDL
jgi:glycosyltransferase involved in cell wall biosynthesis